MNAQLRSSEYTRNRIAKYPHDFPAEPTITRALDRRLQSRREGKIHTKVTMDNVQEKLQRFLEKNISTPFKISGLQPLGGGASKEQFVFDLHEEGAQVHSLRKMVLRCEPPASIVETSLQREFELMRFGAGLMPVPTAQWIDAAGDFMGTPSIISDFVPGVVKTAEIASNVTGMGIHFPEKLRKALAPSYMSYMASLHRAPIPENTLPSFQRWESGTTQAAESILNWWGRTWAEDMYEAIPIATLGESWLRKNAPVLDTLSVVHGDFRTGNFLFDETSLKITAVLDWELGYLGDRHGDLAWVLTDLYTTYEAGRPFHSGIFSSEDELIELYEASGGLLIDRKKLLWHRVFCTWKQLILSLGCALRAADGRTHQDVLLSWLSGCGYTISEALRRQLTQEC